MPTILEAVCRLGQSIWLDSFDRAMLRNGSLKEMIEKQGLRGITSNPALFEKAIAQGDDYTDDIRHLAEGNIDNEQLFFKLAVQDIQQAADLLLPVFRKDPSDGFISLEVSPDLARDTDGTIHQAQQLWDQVHRPNVMIKIPATKEGLPAIRECTRRGINVNITLLFGLSRYQEVTTAYIEGLEARLRDRQSLQNVFSVASFFLSRIDVLVDPMLEQKGMKEAKGQAAIACANAAFELYQGIFQSDRFSALREAGARPQRLLWASMGVKDPAYPALKYVEALMGRDTIGTLPPETLHALLERGQAVQALGKDLSRHLAYLQQLKQAGIDMEAVSSRLEEDGIEKFKKPFRKLLSTIASVREKVHS
jgi:transaldolase/transaldolase/glucose-6-phosphate isomerase